MHHGTLQTALPAGLKATILFTCTGSRQVTSAGFFDRPAGDKKEAKRFENSETKKKKGLYVPLDKKVSVWQARLRILLEVWSLLNAACGCAAAQRCYSRKGKENGISQK